MKNRDDERLQWPDDNGLPASELYLELLKRVLTGLVRPKLYTAAQIPSTVASMPGFDEIASSLQKHSMEIVGCLKPDLKERIGGTEWIPDGETMVGLYRLDNVQECIRQVVKDNVPGDFIETGVWRGGTCIFARGCFKAYGDNSRNVWVADSFKGLPPPNPEQFPADAGDVHSTYSDLAISQEQVKQNFRKYGMLDDRVKFLEGWFKDTLPTAPIEQIAVLRLDGDMYESTMDALTALYHKLSVGGFAIIDDYLWHKPCAQAVEDFRSQHGITEPVIEIDQAGVYWRRER